MTFDYSIVIVVFLLLIVGVFLARRGLSNADRRIRYLETRCDVRTIENQRVLREIYRGAKNKNERVRLSRPLGDVVETWLKNLDEK